MYLKLESVNLFLNFDTFLDAQRILETLVITGNACNYSLHKYWCPFLIYQKLFAFPIQPKHCNLWTVNMHPAHSYCMCNTHIVYYNQSNLRISSYVCNKKKLLFRHMEVSIPYYLILRNQGRSLFIYYQKHIFFWVYV